MVTSQRYTSTDLARLTAAIGTCVRPFDFPTVEDWRSALLDRVMEMLEAPLGRCDLVGLGLAEDRISKGYDGVFDLYVTDFMHLDPTYGLMSRLNMTTYTRRYRHRVAGDAWTARYKRSVVYREFYAPNRLLDAAGIRFSAGGVTAHVHAETWGEGGELMDERGRGLLLALEPAFRAAALSLTGAQRCAWQAHRLLDAIDQPVGLVNRVGKWVHRTPALQVLLDGLGAEDREALLGRINDLALTLLRMPTPAVPDEAWVRQSAPLLERAGLRVSAVLLGPDRPYLQSHVLVQVERTGGGVQLDPARLLQAGLTPREVEVARLLARGLSDKAIAGTLGFSWHTARRHTEKVLAKLGISSRSGVALAMAHSPPGSAH